MMKASARLTPPVTTWPCDDDGRIRLRKRGHSCSWRLGPVNMVLKHSDILGALLSVLHTVYEPSSTRAVPEETFSVHCKCPVP